MSEEEIIKYIKDEIENEIDTFHWFDNTPKNETRRQIEESIKAHQGLLDLYNKEKLNSLNLSEQLNKEKEKNKELFEEYNKRVATIIKYEQEIKEIIDKIDVEDYYCLNETEEDLRKLVE